MMELLEYAPDRYVNLGFLVEAKPRAVNDIRPLSPDEGVDDVYLICRMADGSEIRVEPKYAAAFLEVLAADARSLHTIEKTRDL